MTARRSLRSSSGRPLLVGEVEDQVERRRLHVGQAEHLRQQHRPEGGDRRPHRDAGALAAEGEELAPGTRSASSPARCSAVRAVTFSLGSPGAAMPDTSPLMSARKTGTPAALSCSAITCRVLVLPVPVAPATRPCRFSGDSGMRTLAVGVGVLAVDEQRAQLERGAVERVARADLLGQIRHAALVTWLPASGHPWLLPAQMGEIVRTQIGAGTRRVRVPSNPGKVAPVRCAEPLRYEVAPAVRRGRRTTSPALKGGRGDPGRRGPRRRRGRAAVLTFGAPTVGEILAERYQLEEHINDDSAGRQVWRGVDVILRRPVAVVLRYPGGESAQEMLQAAVTASRVIHPNLAGVYDAIDEGDRAYVVREWVDGEALREIIVGEGPLDAERATTIAHCVASAVAAVHATGMVHGNVHPGTVLVADDGRVVLADARATDGDTTETDVRAIGGVLYFALTGHWPHAEAGPSALPDAVRDGSGAIAAPRQVRAGVPAYLDDLTMDLLDRRLDAAARRRAGRRARPARRGRRRAVPRRRGRAAAVQHRGRGRRDPAGHPAQGRRRRGRAARGRHGRSPAGHQRAVRRRQRHRQPAQQRRRRRQRTRFAGRQPAAGRGEAHAVAAQGRPGPHRRPRRRPHRARRALEALVDGDRDTAWESDSYFNPPFGGKSGMGILIRLPEPREVTSVRVYLTGTGASAELLTGQGDNDGTKAGDQKIVSELQEPDRRAPREARGHDADDGRLPARGEVPVPAGLVLRPAHDARRQAPPRGAGDRRRSSVVSASLRLALLAPSASVRSTLAARRGAASEHRSRARGAPRRARRRRGWG